MAHVVLAMSGGVDSSVAAHLLLRQGHRVTGVFMRHGEDVSPSCASGPLAIVSSGPSSQQGCCTAADAEDARRVADRLDIPFYAVDFRSDFHRITDYFVTEYSAGRTPNPCVVCNNWIKFGRLFEYADALSADFVATGHYARLVPHGTGVGLRRGLDSEKDQSYVLFGVQPQLLHRMLLPVGEFRKPQIRQMARDLGMRIADKRDSQEICFVQPGQHANFVAKRRTRDTTGEIVDTHGHVLARHEGIERFTIGQRKGLGIALGEPAFVVRIDPETNRVVVGTRHDLLGATLTATDANWLDERVPMTFRGAVQTRYNGSAAMGLVQRTPDGRFRVTFDEPVAAIAPGQAAVCYDGDRVLGGGWISHPSGQPAEAFLAMDHSSSDST